MVRQADSALAMYVSGRPGMSVLVARRDTVLYERALGSADLEHQVPITTGTRFLLGSVSKQFTAFAATKLARDGRLRLDEDLRTYLPDLPDYGHRITVSDLIHHTSGIRDQVELLILAGTPMEGLVEQRAALAHIFRQKGLNFTPGSDFQYSNSNYTVLAEVARRAAGMTLRRYLAEQVFGPLRMEATFLSDSATEVVPNRATGYMASGRTFRRALLNYAVFGTTGVWSTPRDLLKWSRELLHPTVFDPELVKAVETPGSLATGERMTYASGLVVAPFAGHPAIYHDGADPGFQSILVNLPEQDATVIALSNGMENASGVAAQLVRIFFGPGSEAALAPTPAPPDSAVARRLAGMYTNDWSPTWRIAVVDGRPTLTIGAGRIPLQFLPDGSFFVGSPANRLTIRSDGALVNRSGLSGTEVVYRRVIPWNPSPADLAQVTGEYRSDEIDTTYRLVAADGKVTLSSLRNPDVPLVPADQNNLETIDARYPTLRLTLQRGGSGRVQSFTLASGRMRGLEFRRVP